MEKSDASKAAIFAEMLASQKSRDELMKWKLIVISSVGAVGLGIFENKNVTTLQLVLVVIPVACVYIDMLCRYLSLRTKRINSFISTLAENNDIDIKYAKYYLAVRRNSGRTLESYVLFWSTIFISVSISFIGFFTKKNDIIYYSFICVGALCIFLSILIEKKYRCQVKRIESQSKMN